MALLAINNYQLTIINYQLPLHQLIIDNCSLAASIPCTLIIVSTSQSAKAPKRH
jgi:hypothetical protein